ncbi:MAG: CHAD domain-containing protein [Pirellulaceae bacterium]
MTSLTHELLHDRLSDVLRLLPLAANHADDDPEYVHRLRIATRESLAALDAFCEHLPAKETAWLRKQLKRIRSAAGQARDLDVMLRRYADSDIAGRKKILRRLRCKRDRAQQPLVKILRRVNRQGRFRQSTDACLVAIGSVPSDRVTLMLANRIYNAAQSMLECSPNANADGVSLHRFRVKAKQLRYALELTRGSEADERLCELYTTAKEIQKKLGLMSDHIVAAARLESMNKRAKSKRFAGQLKREWKCEKLKAKQARKDFIRWWKSSQVVVAESLTNSRLFYAAIQEPFAS